MTFNPFSGAVTSGQFIVPPAQYAPGVRATPNTAVATYAAVDTNNIQTGSFKAPASGSVLVSFSLIAAVGAATGRCGFSVAAHGTTVALANACVPVLGTNLTAVSGELLVTGLTPFSLNNLDLIYCSIDLATLTVYALGSGSAAPVNSGGPVILSVQAV